ncbi:hypothetical protein PMAYCL1PPCAC_05314, partial [Pristionchus mayeri]
MYYEGTRIVHDCFCTSAILINILLIVIIIRKTPHKLSSYSIILLNFAIIEIASAIASLFIFNRAILLNPRDADKYTVFASTGPCRLTGSSRVCLAASAFLSHGHCHFYILLGFSFCFRYISIKYSAPNTHRLYYTLALLYTPTAVVYTIFGAAPILDSSTLEIVMKASHPRYDFNASAKSELLIGQTICDFLSNNIVFSQAILIPAYVVIIVSAFRIHRLLSSSLRMSEKSRRMHKEIMQGLIFQAMLPLFYVTVIGVNQAFRARILPDWKENGYLLITVSAMTLTASPLSTLFFIRPYRLALVSMFGRRTYLYSPPGTTE